MRVFIETLGCPKNSVDSEGMAALFEKAGHLLVESPEHAHVLIVNTCGFIEPARLESLDALRQLGARKRKHQRLIAAGCLAEKWGERLYNEIPQLDGVLSTRRWAEILSLIEELSPGTSLRQQRPTWTGDSPAHLEKDRALRRPVAGPSAFLKIADGCSAPCSFCAIPSIKGPARSRRPEHIMEEAKELVQRGVRELILIAQDTTAYGQDLGISDGLSILIEEILAAVPQLDWLRIMYAYPQRISSRLIEIMATSPQICHYLDIPLQHGHPDVLRRMRRPHDLEQVLAQIDALRAAMPDIALRTSFIVGFPGETEAEFDALLKFVERIQFDKIGTFIYSAEAGTPAAEMPNQVPEDVKRERYQRLMEHQQRISLARNRTQIGRILQAIVEGKGDGISVGRTYRDAPEIDGLLIVEEEAEIGDFRMARIIHASEYDLWGEWTLSPVGEAVGSLPTPHNGTMPSA